LFYDGGMTRDQIDTVLQRIRSWPESRQEEAVELLLALETLGDEPYTLSDEERASVRRGLEDARHGRFASDEEMAALFNRGR
jgi:predicted transcriptional regulator